MITNTNMRVPMASFALALSSLLVACSGSNAPSFPNTSQITGGNNTGGVAATGAPLANVPFTVKKLDGTVVANGTVGSDAYFQTQLAAENAPYLIEVTDTSVSPSQAYQAMLLAGDFDASGKANINVTPISTMVTTIALNAGASGKTATELQTLRTSAAESVKTAIKPLLDAANVTLSANELLTKVFTPVSDPLDKVLDTMHISCAATTCTLAPASTQAVSKIGGSGVLTLDVSSASAAQTSASSVASKLNTSSVTNTMLSSAPVVVVFSAASSWGGENDSWAGYTGKFAIYNFSDLAIEGGSKLYFESKDLSTQGFWDVTPSVSSEKYLLTLPAWANMAPITAGAPATYTFGFNGKGHPRSVKDLRSCNINGKKCLILVDDGSNLIPGTDTASKIRSWSNFLASMPVPIQSKKPAAALPPPNEDPEKKTTTASNTSSSSGGGGTAVAKVGLASTASWTGGFNGELQLANSGNTDWTSWKVSFTMPSGITDIGGWGNYKLAVSGRTATFQNESWNGKLAAGKTLKMGFGGAGALIGALSNCMISINGGTDVACESTAAASTTSAPTPAAQPTATAPAPAPTPAPTSNPVPTPSTSSAGAGTSTGTAEPTAVAGSIKADQTKRVFVGYYPSWSDNWFASKDWAGNALTDDQILAASKLARIPGTYTHVVVAFAKPDFTYSTSANFTANKWDGTGLNFNAGPQDIKRAVDVLHARNMKVLLAVGGATYNEWGALAAENGSTTGPITKALTQLLLDVGFDGLDVDYEVEGITTPNYKGAVNAMRTAVDLANAADSKGRVLAVAAWSTGADCTATTGATACGGATSYWGGKAGGERLVFSDAAMADKIDMVNIMSYDARFENYDGVKAWLLYRGLFPSKTIVSIGLETAPEGWAGGMLVVEDSHATCTGATILKDQLGTAVNQPYSVHRYASAVTAGAPGNSNPRDGTMIWQILKKANAACGSAVVATPRTVVTKISSLYGLPSDARSAWE